MRSDACGRPKAWPYVAALTASGVALTAYIRLHWNEIANEQYPAME